jgi:non-specific serine/threonine protein kinase/serine/threonine-protein kinase
LFDELLDLPESEREAALAMSCADDADVRTEVLGLLRASEAAGDFLASPAQPPVTGPGDHADLRSGADIGLELGSWRIVRRIGTGGMGDVYEAVRTSGDFEQHAALKLLRADVLSGAERFHSERQILARLAHAGIARLYDGGVSSDGRPYMVMEYVRGRTITDYCRDTRADLPQRLNLFLKVCDAVSHAHRNLVVHRDLKPSNILVTEAGEVKLLDFGIAKLIDGQHVALTRSAAAPLTPTCAAPEQLTGGEITTATDVFALGVLLFELLTGTHPWVRPELSAAQAMRAAVEGSLPRPSRVVVAGPISAKALEGDLDAIIGKALRSEPTSRYPSVDALGQDLRRYLSGEPVIAREGARLYVLGRLLRRYRWPVAGVTTIFLTLLGALAVSIAQVRRANVERDIAQTSAAREEAIRDQLTHLFGTAISEHRGMPASAKSVIDRSAHEVLTQYRSDPKVAGPLVLTLSDLYGSLQDVEGRGALLEGFIQAYGGTADPAEIAQARQSLAEIELARGHANRAGELLDQAQAYWLRSPDRYLEERLQGSGIRVILLRAEGNIEGAVDAARLAIRERIAASGLNFRETANLYNSLALTLMSARRYDEAIEAFEQTISIYEHLGQGDGLDAQVVRANTAVLQLVRGHLREAEGPLREAIERQRALGGDSAAVSSAIGAYGRLLTLTNRSPEAIDVLNTGVAMADRYAGAESPAAVQCRIYLTEAQIAVGKLADARATLSAVQRAAAAHFKVPHPFGWRLQTLSARLEAASRHPQEARIAVTSAVDGLRPLGVAGAPYLADALELRGDIELGAGQAAAALADYRDEVSVREGLKFESWELFQARERLGEAMAASGNPGQARALLVAAEMGLSAALGADHPQAARARAALQRLPPGERST